MKRLVFVCLSAMLLSACTSSPSPNPYEQGLIRYNDQWITREEYERQTSSPQPIPETVPESAPVSEPEPVSEPTPTEEEEAGLDDVDGDEEVEETEAEDKEEQEEEEESTVEIGLDYSWHFVSVGASVHTYITNLSDERVDVSWRVKAFNSDEVNIYDETFNIQDIWSGETFYQEHDVRESQITDVIVNLIDAQKTTVPPVGSRTDLVIVDDMPLVPDPEHSPEVRIQNTTNQSLYAGIEVRHYDNEGYLTSVQLAVGESIDPFETKLIRLEGLTPRDWFVYVVDWP